MRHIRIYLWELVGELNEIICTKPCLSVWHMERAQHLLVTLIYLSMEVCGVFSKKNYVSIQTNSTITRNVERIWGKKWDEDIFRDKGQKALMGGKRRRNKRRSNQNAGNWEIHVSHEQSGRYRGKSNGLRVSAWRFGISQVPSESHWLSPGPSFIISKAGTMLPGLPDSAD